MPDPNEAPANTLFIEVSGAGIPEVDGLFVPSVAPPTTSESGTVSTPGYWNGRMAWDRADGKSARSPALSYSNSYTSWRICRLDGHLAYHTTGDDPLPPTDRKWDVYRKGVAPAPSVVIRHVDPREPCPPPNIVFVLGGPGAGKGTMCELAELQLGWTHLSTGELLRAEQAASGPDADTIASFIAEGKLVPDDIVVRLLKNKTEQVTRSTGRTHFLLDGFPRSLGNVDAWREEFGHGIELPAMFYFECPFEVLEKRVMGRAKHTGRSDDNIESLKRRFDTYKAETLPTVQRFKSLCRCVKIDTSQSRQAVYDVVASYLGEFTTEAVEPKPLSERAEMLLGLRPWPKK